MKKILLLTSTVAVLITLTGCLESNTANSREVRAVARQQSQYEKSQPVPAFDYSLERELVSQLYKIRNANVITHSVWRSDYGMIQGDCSSMGYGIPYDVSLTNPLAATNDNMRGNKIGQGALTSIEQPEPNGIFASKNTNATWVMCIGDAGDLDPVYVEAKVNVYPYSLEVDYESDRVMKKGKSTVSINKKSLLMEGVETGLTIETSE
jgi:hypothetical protein